MRSADSFGAELVSTPLHRAEVNLHQRQAYEGISSVADDAKSTRHIGRLEAQRIASRPYAPARLL